MDAGKKFIGITEDPANIDNATVSDEKVNRGNIQAPTEDMSLPIAIYLVEEE